MLFHLLRHRGVRMQSTYQDTVMRNLEKAQKITTGILALCIVSTWVGNAREISSLREKIRNHEKGFGIAIHELTMAVDDLKNVVNKHDS